MTQTTLYGGSEPLYETLMQFIIESGRIVEHDGEEYAIEHTQFASYNIKEPFAVLAEQTDAHPIEDPTEFTTEADEILAENTHACIDNHKAHRFYTNREYFSSTDFTSAATTYLTLATDDQNDDRGFTAPYTINEDTPREQCIADILTLLSAEEAGWFAYRKFGISTNSGITTEQGDKHHLDEEVPDKEVAFTIRETIERHNARSVITQPNPSKRLITILFNIYDTAGMNPSIREVYGALVDPNPKQMYTPDDAQDRKMKKSIGRIGAAVMGGAESDAKWESVNEPPLETIKDSDD
jgi:hypothetical protein